jgi:hypothetical protein
MIFVFFLVSFIVLQKFTFTRVRLVFSHLFLSLDSIFHYYPFLRSLISFDLLRRVFKTSQVSRSRYLFVLEALVLS